MTLAQRMAAIRNAAHGITKDSIRMKSERTGKEFTIKGHIAEAILSEIRPLFTQFDVLLTPNLVERTYNGNRCDVLVDFEFETLDEPVERRTVRWAGAGTDNGDKGFSKAGTNALKEMLKKVFQITDRDDVKEEEEKVEHETEGASRAKLDEAKEMARAALEKWATSFKAALEDAQSLDRIKTLERENKSQLTSESLPAVTRGFFIDLITKRKAELSK